MERWPGLVIAPGTPVLLQEPGGVCMAERTVRAQARLAAEAGATVREETAVQAIEPAGDGVEVTTDRGEAFTRRRGGRDGRAVGRTAAADRRHRPPAGAVVRAGDVLPAGGRAACRSRRSSIGPACRRSASRATATARRTRPYALPNPEEPGSIKMALDRSGPDVDPDTRSFEPDPERLDTARGLGAKRFLPLVEARPPETCLYTNTPDGEFVLDRLGPIVVGSPCSGHGFKFAPLIGKILADMATGHADRAAA